VSPPFLPSVYDGDIFISSASVLDALFPNLEMIGDNHFRKASPLAGGEESVLEFR
jgi:hypothetical protein